jgi:3-dehydroquinate dehydratase/shikimate dehydrogenase
MTTQICVAIRESTTAAAVASAVRAAKWADLVEFRADYLQDLDLRELLRNKPCPAIFTLRARPEGGEYGGPEGERIRTIIEASHENADYVDVEFSSNWKLVLDIVPRQKVILSYHNFDETPANLEAKLDLMAATGAGILKIVTRAGCLADNVRIARLLNYASTLRVKLIALAMGSAGIPSRILAGLWGSWLTFASMPGGNATAEGQYSADQLEDLYRVRQIGFETELYGVLGRPLGHSLSPLIHNTAFSHLGMNAVFLPLEAVSVQDFAAFQEMSRLRGSSVTIPYKEAIRAETQSLSAAADQVGAINTLVCKENGWHGENTDVQGFLRPLLGRMQLARMKVAVLGAGGAARAVVYALRSQGTAVCVIGRNRERAAILAETFGAEHAGWDQLRHIRWDLLVNATPVGMSPNVNESPVPADVLDGEWVYDLVYNPGETCLLRQAAQRGCKTIGGAEMFLAQALEQQKLWFGIDGPEKAMREALNHALQKKEND